MFLDHFRVLGHFERPLFLELCKYMESRFLPAGSYLFKVGDPDDSIYVVQSGKIKVFISDKVILFNLYSFTIVNKQLNCQSLNHEHICYFQNGQEYNVKEVNSGDSIHSLLSVLDVLTVS